MHNRDHNQIKSLIVYRQQKHTAVYLSGPPRPGCGNLGPPQHCGPQQAWLSAVQPHGQRPPDWPSSQEIQQANDKA